MYSYKYIDGDSFHISHLVSYLLVNTNFKKYALSELYLLLRSIHELQKTNLYMSYKYNYLCDW